MQTAIEDVKLTAKRIFSLIATELTQVESEFERQARSNVQVIAYLGEYLRESGGKRVRPALTILSNYAVGGDGSTYNSIRMATVMEFLHTATLVHDDIIDSADTRRNRPTVNAIYGNETAVLMGDWLYMSAFETSLAERSLPILDILTRVTRKMTEGELLQLTTLGRTDISEEQYLDIIERKTAYLFSACCEVGAILGSASHSASAGPSPDGPMDLDRKALRDYGMNLGLAFQITDDLLDFTSTDDTLGKAAGVDLLGGKVTLPLIYLLANDGSAREKIQTVISDKSYERVSRRELLEAVDRSGARELARARADEYAEAARTALDILPDSEYCESLRAIPGYVLDRTQLARDITIHDKMQTTPHQVQTTHDQVQLESDSKVLQREESVQAQIVMCIAARPHESVKLGSKLGILTFMFTLLVYLVGGVLVVNPVISVLGILACVLFWVMAIADERLFHR